MGSFLYPLYLGGTDGLPRRVTDIRARVLAVSTAGNSTCFLVEGGDVLCAGEVLGPDRGKPARSVHLPEPAMALSTGSLAGCAALVDGNIWCWGVGSVADEMPSFHGEPFAIKCPDELKK